jgi:hypothetical protein
MDFDGKKLEYKSMTMQIYLYIMSHSVYFPEDL